MTIDITIGKREESAPLFLCALVGHSACPGEACRECVCQVRQEVQAGAPCIETVTAVGLKCGGYNFANGIPIGSYFRIVAETHLVERYPLFNLHDMPVVHPIPDTLPGSLHRLAIEVEVGLVVTSYPLPDTEFLCWLAWWTGYALKSYGLQAAIEFS